MNRADSLPGPDSFPTLLTDTSPQVSLPAEEDGMPASGRAFLDYLLREQFVFADEISEFLARNQAAVCKYRDAELLGAALVADRILSNYQFDRIMGGNTYGLVIGNYRILDRIGAGAMGVVYRGEHLFMRRPVALKVLPVDEDCPEVHLRRFYAEMRALAGLHHRNIVLAYDAGKLTPSSPALPMLVYLAMELIDGCDLDRHVSEQGRPAVEQACEWIRQAACGLQEAHDHHIVHRDIKPSNMLLTQDGCVKLGDFGLVRQFSLRLTDPKALLGTVEFMAPEQSIDPTNVGSAADIFGLGASLFWLLTGATPYPRGKSMSEAISNLQQAPARRLLCYRPDAPKPLQDLLDRLLDRDPTRRPALPITVMNALAPFAE